MRECYVASKEFYHYNQLELFGKLQKYDYSLYKEETTNQMKYGQDEPPVLPLEDIDTPVGMWIGELDQIGDLADNKKVKEVLQNVQKFEVVDGFYHNTFSDANHDIKPYMQQIILFLEENIPRTWGIL